MKKKCMVYKYSDENLGLIDYRMLPPKIVSPIENPEVDLIQRDVDEIEIIKGSDFSFFTPSLVSIQLNAAKPAILRCKELTKQLTSLAEKQKNESGTKTHDQLIQDFAVAKPPYDLRTFLTLASSISNKSADNCLYKLIAANSPFPKPLAFSMKLPVSAL